MSLSPFWAMIASCGFIFALRYALFVKFAIIDTIGFGRPSLARFKASKVSIITGLLSAAALTLVSADIARKPASMVFGVFVILYVMSTFGDVTNASEGS